MINQRRWLAATLLVICITPTFLWSTTLGKTSDEKGEAIIDKIVCTKEGKLLIFYHREYILTDIMEYSGPYVRILQVTKDGTLQDIHEVEGPLYSLRQLVSEYGFWGLVQEDTTALRLVGWNGGELTEFIWSKEKHTLEITTPGTSFTYPHFLCTWVYFPRQVQYTAIIQNYTLSGWTECEDKPVVITTNGTTTEKIHPQDMSQGDDYKVYAAFIADGSGEAYYAHLITGTNDILIRKLSANMTILTETQMTINGTPTSIFPMHGRIEDLFCLDALLGRNNNPYVGVRVLDFRHEMALDTYQHTFELVNLKKNTSVVVPIPAKDNYYDWAGLVDVIGTFHGFFYTNPADSSIRYIRISSDGTITSDTTFTPGTIQRERRDSGPIEYIGGEKIVTFWGQDHIIVAENSALFLFDVVSGTVVNFESELIPFSSYKKMPWKGIIGLATFSIISICIRMKKKK